MLFIVSFSIRQKAVWGLLTVIGLWLLVTKKGHRRAPKQSN